MYKPIKLHNTDFPIAHYLTENKLLPPLVVGGVGGSGTRLVAQLLQNMGIFMGDYLNEAEDALAFMQIYEGYINNYLMGVANYQQLADELLRAMIYHRKNCSANSQWGWKNPRSIYLLPILDCLIPNLRFIHVVRDGLAISTSDNQMQLEKHGLSILQNDMQTLPKKQQSLLLWSIVNNAAADYGKLMGDRYFLVRYEDVCENPNKVFSTLAHSLGLQLPNVWDVSINSPRMRQESMNQQYFSSTTIEYITNALKRFGYLC
jgi:hypothetical protein